MGGLERAGDINPAIELTAQLRPELGQTRQLDIDLPGELLLQAALAVDAVVAQAYLQRIEVPLLAAAIGLGLDHRRLATQFAFQIKVGAQAEFFILDFPLAAQRAGQGAGQFRHPVRRVDRRQIQRGIPGDAIGELQVQMPFSLALAGRELNLLQVDFRQVTRERTGQAERPGRTVQRGVEVAEVLDRPYRKLRH